jgi:hypothetical protein
MDSWIIAGVVLVVCAVAGWLIYRRLHKPTPKSSTVIGAVRNVRIYSAGLFTGSPSFAFVWDPPSSGAGPGYDIAYAYTITDPSGAKTSAQAQKSAIAPLPSPLKDGTYSISVTASNQFGSGPSATGSSDLSLRPGAVTGITLVPATNDQPQNYFKWNRAADGLDADAPVSYAVKLTDPKGVSTTGQTQGPAWPIPQPAVNGTYAIKITPSNKYGQGPSATGQGAVVVFSITNTSANWVANSSAPGAYTLQLSADVTGFESGDRITVEPQYPDGSPVIMQGGCSALPLSTTCTSTGSGTSRCVATTAPTYGVDPSKVPACSAFPTADRASRGKAFNLVFRALSPTAGSSQPTPATVPSKFPGSSTPASVSNIRMSQ